MSREVHESVVLAQDRAGLCRHLIGLNTPVRPSSDPSSVLPSLATLPGSLTLLRHSYSHISSSPRSMLQYYSSSSHNRLHSLSLPNSPISRHISSHFSSRRITRRSVPASPTHHLPQVIPPACCSTCRRATSRSACRQEQQERKQHQQQQQQDQVAVCLLEASLGGS